MISAGFAVCLVCRLRCGSPAGSQFRQDLLAHLHLNGLKLSDSSVAVHRLLADSSGAKAACSQHPSDGPSLLRTGGHPCLLKLLLVLICHKIHPCK